MEAVAHGGRAGAPRGPGFQPERLTPTPLSSRPPPFLRWIWSSDAGGSFNLSEDKGENGDLGRGTLIKIHLKPEALVGRGSRERRGRARRGAPRPGSVRAPAAALQRPVCADHSQNHGSRPNQPAPPPPPPPPGVRRGVQAARAGVQVQRVHQLPHLHGGAGRLHVGGVGWRGARRAWLRRSGPPLGLTSVLLNPHPGPRPYPRPRPSRRWTCPWRTTRTPPRRRVRRGGALGGRARPLEEARRPARCTPALTPHHNPALSVPSSRS
jgi:hypothetical protein